MTKTVRRKQSWIWWAIPFACLLCFESWWVATRIPFGYSWTQYGFGLQAGNFVFRHGQQIPPSGLIFDFQETPDPAIGQWWPSWGQTPGTAYRFVALPLWPLVVLLAVWMIIRWRRDVARRPGHCPTCGFDLPGNESGTCPECGTAVEQRTKTNDATTPTHGA